MSSVEKGLVAFLGRRLSRVEQLQERDRLLPRTLSKQADHCSIRGVQCSEQGWDSKVSIVLADDAHAPELGGNHGCWAELVTYCRRRTSSVANPCMNGGVTHQRNTVVRISSFNWNTTTAISTFPSPSSNYSPDGQQLSAGLHALLRPTKYFCRLLRTTKEQLGQTYPPARQPQSRCRGGPGTAR